jgi:hypothetical protein
LIASTFNEPQYEMQYKHHCGGNCFPLGNHIPLLHALVILKCNNMIRNNISEITFANVNVTFILINIYDVINKSITKDNENKDILL